VETLVKQGRGVGKPPKAKDACVAAKEKKKEMFEVRKEGSKTTPTNKFVRGKKNSKTPEFCKINIGIHK